MGFREEFDSIAQREARGAAARNIFNEVEDWRGTKRAVASKRWIWELLQNAKDCARGRPFTFALALKQNALVVRHDAGPFTLRDIVALVEGDSSKHRRAEDTTGRFGKGFLVSHVVSTDVQVRGILADEKKGKFSFTFRLRRYGSEGEIRHNIEKCRDDLDNATLHPADDSSTEFIYYLTPGEETQSCIDDAVVGLRNHAPYLFSFMPELQSLTVELRSEPPLVFATAARQRLDAGNLPATVEKVSVCEPGGTRTVLLFTQASAPHGAQPQVAFRLDADGRIVTPSVVARVFQALPLHGTAEFDIPVVLNLPSSCDVDSDRAFPNISKADTQRAIHNALMLLPAIVDWGVREQMRGLHLLAEFGISHQMKREPRSASVWEESISEVVNALSRCRLVECGTGFRRIEDVSFPDVMWLEDVQEDNFLLLALQRLLSSHGDSVPNADVVEEWAGILKKWRTIQGVPVKGRIGLGYLFSELQDAESLSSFRRRRPIFGSEDAALAYLSDLFQVAAEYCNRHKISAPAALKTAPVVLTQSGKFREGRVLNLDGGIDPVLKDISQQLGLNFREKLVHLGLTRSSGYRLISQLCGENTFVTENAVGALVTDIEGRFSSGRTKGPDGQVLETAAVLLLAWLAAHPYAAPAELRSFPLLCADGKLHAVNEYHDIFIAPAALLSEEDRNWIDLFPDSVRLSDQYAHRCEALQTPAPMLATFLAKQFLASASILIERELNSEAEHFPEMYRDTALSGHRVERVSARDIAGFTRLLSETAGASSSGDWEKAKRVLSFILSYVTSKDDSWKSAMPAICTRNHGCTGSVELFPCSWLARAKHSHWVPSFEKEGPCEPLSRRNINELWQRLPSQDSQSAQARDFLALHFGVDRLEMAIRASAGDDIQRKAELREQLAAVVDMGVDPQELSEFVGRRRTLKEINSRNGRLGRIVETLVAQAFELEGFEVRRTGIGSDFLVRLADAKDLEWDKQDIGELRFSAAYHGVPVEFLVEVKATRGDAVRMSWRQAEAAANNLKTYVLCVVDFEAHQDLFDQVLQEDAATCSCIAPCMGLVPTIGENLAASVENLNSAMETHDPGVEVEKGEEIRFRIAKRLWREGSKLSDWAAAVKDAIASEQAGGREDSARDY